jgi:hypothetical protein
MWRCFVSSLMVPALIGSCCRPDAGNQARAAGNHSLRAASSGQQRTYLRQATQHHAGDRSSAGEQSHAEAGAGIFTFRYGTFHLLEPVNGKI